MEAPEPELRKVRKPGKKLDDEDAYSPYLDIFRVLTFLFLASCGLSYLVSGGETWSWGMKDPPKYLQTTWWKSQLVRQPLITPTRSQLRHPGTNKPSAPTLARPPLSHPHRTRRV